MRILILDITGRNSEQYNPSLCKALSKVAHKDKVVLMAPTCYNVSEDFEFKRLCRLVPLSQTLSTSKTKRLIRALEALINYVRVFFYILYHKVAVLHFQWLVFVDYTTIESTFMKLIRLVRPKIKIYLTVHNIFPHDLTESEITNYKRRFLEIGRNIDGFIVHLESAKDEFVSSYGISPQKVFVAYHGIYVADNFKVKKIIKDEKTVNIILFGTQTQYKGADIFLEALHLMPELYKNKINAMIIGSTPSDYYNKFKDKARALGVKWINKFVSDEELYEAIGKSDLILLPYRKISQSGALLLSLSYKKPILTSRLPSFVETMKGYPSDYFFEPDDPNSLAEKIIDYINGKIDTDKMCIVIEKLNLIYSWEESANMTLDSYGIRK